MTTIEDPPGDEIAEFEAEFENEADVDDEEDVDEIPVDKGWEDVALPDVGTIKLQTMSGHCGLDCTCHVHDPVRVAEMNAELAARGVPLLDRKPPTGYGAKKYAPIWRALRSAFLAGGVETWAVYGWALNEGTIHSGRYQGEVAPAVPERGISVRWTDGRRWGGTLDELGVMLGVEGPQRAARAPSATKARIVELEAALARADSLILELTAAAHATNAAPISAPKRPRFRPAKSH